MPSLDGPLTRHLPEAGHGVVAVVMQPLAGPSGSDAASTT